MKTNRTTSLLAPVLFALAAMTHQPIHSAPVGTAFTYQGLLMEQGQPANGVYDFQFILRDAPSGGDKLRGTETKLAVGVSDGVFTVAIDFGSSAFDGDARWLEIAARTNGAATFTSLTPLQSLRPNPYAITARGISGTMQASQITGSLGSNSLAGPYGNALTFNNPSNHYTGDGSGLRFGGFSYTNFPFYWNVKGNAGTTPALHFVGTLDSQPLELRVDGQRALRLEPTAASPNLIGGFGGNYVDAGVIGSTIGGGGRLEAANQILATANNSVVSPPEFATIAGGLGNTISVASYVTIGGGAENSIAQTEWSLPVAPKLYSVIAGGLGNSASGAWMSTISGGAFNKFPGGTGRDIRGGTIGGGIGNVISPGEDTVLQPTIAGGASNFIAIASFTTIGGGRVNLINPFSTGATISGGELNTIGVQSANATLAGGFSNRIEVRGIGATVSGGAQNSIEDNARFAIIGGGLANSVGEYSTGAVVSGGEANQVNSPYGNVGGGVSNLIETNTLNATIGGGNGNTIRGSVSVSILGEVRNGTIGGGGNNELRANADYATISGGASNLINIFGRGSFIGGGQNNSIAEHSTHCAVAAGLNNSISDNSDGITIGGGIMNRIGDTGFHHTISGGTGNGIFGHTSAGTIGGGIGNVLGGSYNTISGGRTNTIFGGTVNNTIAGGFGNQIDVNADNATIGGGVGNEIGVLANGAIISGGESNHASGPYSTVAGGQLNIADGTNCFASGYGAQASGFCSTAIGNTTIANGSGATALGNRTIATGVGASAIGGGCQATTNASTAMGGGSIASGVASTAMGGSAEASGYVSTAMGNDTTASGDNSTAMGVRTVASGGASTAIGALTTASGSASTAMGARTTASGFVAAAMGYRAQATNDGTFVWADSEDADFASTGTNQFLIRASGGVGINTDSPQFALHVNGDAGKPGGGAWSVASDARLKKDIRPLEQALARLLQLHGVTFEYKDPAAIHELHGQQTGMVAQDVEKVFPEWVETGRDGMKRLSIRGFEALAVEALRELRAEKDAQIQARDEQLSAMEKRLAALERAVATTQPLSPQGISRTLLPQTDKD